MLGFSHRICPACPRLFSPHLANLGAKQVSVIGVCNAKPGPKPCRMGNSHGLFLLVQPTGGNLWRFKYRVDGRGKKRLRVEVAT